jgi:phage terminase large subunit-like protein
MAGLAARLVWPNGAVAQVFSAHDPESLRGPQFDAAWVDELAKWKRRRRPGTACSSRCGWAKTRAGGDDDAAECGVLKAILKNPSTVITHAPTEANRAYLAASFPGRGAHALWRDAAGAAGAGWACCWRMPRARFGPRRCWRAAGGAAPSCRRIVVAVDPPVTGHGGSDECGIVVVGAVTEGPPRDWRAYVLEDASVQAPAPRPGPRRRWPRWTAQGADRLVAEVNQGGDLVETVIAQVDALVPYRAVRASAGKVVRAEPVAALYEQGRVSPSSARACAAGGPDVPHDGTGLSGQGQPGPGGCAGLGA